MQEKIKPTVLFKFDYCDYNSSVEDDNHIKIFRTFIEQFETPLEAIIFLENVYLAAVCDYGLIKSLYDSEEDRIYDEDYEPMTPDIEVDDFQDVRNIDELIGFLRDNGRKTTPIELINFRRYADNHHNFNFKLSFLSKMVESGLLFVVTNKFKYPTVTIPGRLMSLLLNRNYIFKNEFAIDEQNIKSILSLLTETIGTGRIDEMMYVNKMVHVTDGRVNMMIEDSRRKMISHSDFDDFSINFVALPSYTGEFRRKGLQLFEMMMDHNKVALINCLKN